MELEPLVSEAGGTFLQRGLRSIDPQQRQALLDDGAQIDFDAAVVCVGAKPRIVFGHAATLRTSGDPIDIDALLHQAAEHESKRIAFVLPPTGSWPLPVYELALMTEQRARSLSLDVMFTIVTPEPEPLFVFGRVASEAIASMLTARRIEIRTGVRAGEDAAGGLRLEPGREHLATGAVVALPELRGPAVPGLPADQQGFIPIDEHGRVRGTAGVYAAGDGTNFPVKHGGLGTQQADAAAEHIAAEAGAAIEPRPFHPVIRGKLITGDETLSLQTDIGGGAGEGATSLDPLWWPPQKIAGKYLSAMLAGDAPQGSSRRPITGSRWRCRSTESGTASRWPSTRSRLTAVWLSVEPGH